MSCTGLKNVDRFVDRHGKPRHYYRAGRGKRVRLPGEPGSPEYMAAYAAASQETCQQADRCAPATEARDGWA